MFSDLCFPYPEFQVGRVAFDGTNYYIFIFDTICSPKKFLKFQKTADTVLKFIYIAIKLSNFKSVDKKLPELEPPVFHSFDIKVVPRKKLLKVSLKPTSGEIFLFKNLVLHMRYHIFFRYFKALPLIYPYG